MDTARDAYAKGSYCYLLTAGLAETPGTKVSVELTGALGFVVAALTVNANIAGRFPPSLALMFAEPAPT